jgi:uncharacterized membrane protein
MTNEHNAAISLLSATPTYIVAFFQQTDIAVVAALVLPCIFFVLGKAVDVAVRIYLERRNK